MERAVSAIPRQVFLAGGKRFDDALVAPGAYKCVQNGVRVEIDLDFHHFAVLTAVFFALDLQRDVIRLVLRKNGAVIGNIVLLNSPSR